MHRWRDRGCGWQAGRLSQPAVGMLPEGVGVCLRVGSPVDVGFFLGLIDDVLYIEVPFEFSTFFHEIDSSIPSSLS